MTEKQQARKFMAESLWDYVECGELQCTQLAEDAAFELGHAEWLDDPNHWIWDLPIQLSEKIGFGQ